MPALALSRKQIFPEIFDLDHPEISPDGTFATGQNGIKESGARPLCHAWFDSFEQILDFVQ